MQSMRHGAGAVVAAVEPARSERLVAAAVDVGLLDDLVRCGDHALDPPGRRGRRDQAAVHQRALRGRRRGRHERGAATARGGGALGHRAGREDERARDGQRDNEQLVAEGGRHSLSNAYGVSCRARAERARAPSLKKVRPSDRSHLGSPVPRLRGFGVAGKLPDVSARVAGSFNAVLHEFGPCPPSPAAVRQAPAVPGAPPPPSARRASPRSTRSSDQEISAISDSAIASTVRYANSVSTPGTPSLRSRWSTWWSARKPRVKLGLAGTSFGGNRLVSRHVERHRDQRVALLDAHSRLPAVVDGDRLRRPVDPLPHLLQRVDHAAAALPGRDVHELGVVHRFARVEPDRRGDRALLAGVDVPERDLRALRAGRRERAAPSRSRRSAPGRRRAPRGGRRSRAGARPRG